MKSSKYPHLKLVKHQPAYPNAADPQYYHQKALDLVTAIISGMGLASAMVFLVTMA